MKLDAIAERYATQLYGQRIEQLSREHQQRMQELLRDLGRRNILRSGMATSATVRLRLDLVRSQVEALIQSRLDAYEKSGIPLEEQDVQEEARNSPPGSNFWMR